MKMKVIAPAFAALALAFAAPAAHAGCDGMSGKDLKKCEKKAKAQAKADARTTPYVPSSLSPALAAWDGENNPFATDEYRVRVNETGVATVDQWSAKAFRMQAIVVGSKFIVDEIGKGNADAIKAAPALVPLLAEVPQLAQSIIQEGQGMPQALPAALAGPDLLKVPKLLPAIADTTKALTAATKEAPKVLGSLKSVVKAPGDAAGAAAGVAADESGATEVMENAKEAVEDVKPE